VTLPPSSAVRALADARVRDFFVESLRHVASTVVLVTTYVEGRPWGMTVSAFCSVSVNPPTCLVSLNRDTATTKSIVGSGLFGVAILSDTQVPLALRGSAPKMPRYVADLCVEESLALPGWDTSTETESPVLVGASHPMAGGLRTPRPAGSVAHLDCTVRAIHDAEDHVLVVGRVRGVELAKEERQPLLYHNRTFRSLGPAIDN
jgi:flavin reductase ActVB